MAEFSLERDEFTHEVLTDGAIHKVATAGSDVTISRFGIFCFYQFSTSYSSGYRFRVLAQPRPEIRLIFVSKGQGVHIGCHRETKVFSSEESNCSFVKEGCSQDLVIPSGEACELFMLVVGLADISLPIADSQPILRNFLQTNSCSWLLDEQHMLLGMRKISVIQQILHEKKPTYLQAAYSQLKLAELFVLFLEKAGRFGSEDGSVQLRPEELERIRKVRSMLEDNLAASYSLVGLAHAVGTNEASLKKNFKAVYGTTVFGYLTACRMERAKVLLTNGQLKVALVAQEVGYKYASHFSAAFRKYFGYLPTKLLRMVVSVPAYLSGAASMEVFTCLAVL
ncbi:hypothetical protein GCM10007415_31840 [Parapedobacter pyrenivorans]|uniref:HTH araC/xylS-type domain-containing protein n=1 Tax=Parapedobacter pyrenivorans TaxID=1305674 RepID=A0A917MEU3_9SPHI|nr:AraC family transcriptional regulator [Parapedobacter pyrenivorans]GGG94365.1 hypothetical protein GCM10007415_31840 [Parapedobacter pyrenivorans]